MRFEKEVDSEEGPTVIECGYDYLGRRYMKRVTQNGTVAKHERYIYRGYLQIAALDLKRAAHPALWYVLWDPTEPVATRPLAIQKDGTWYTYGHDLTKNVWELYKADGTIASTYDYAPFGGVTTNGTAEQPFQWSSEFYDAELGMVYYNFRFYNPLDGRWIQREPIGEAESINLYNFLINCVLIYNDRLGYQAIRIPRRPLPQRVLTHKDKIPRIPNPKLNGDPENNAIELAGEAIDTVDENYKEAETKGRNLGIQVGLSKIFSQECKKCQQQAKAVAKLCDGCCIITIAFLTEYSAPPSGRWIGISVWGSRFVNRECREGDTVEIGLVDITTKLIKDFKYSMSQNESPCKNA